MKAGDTIVWERTFDDEDVEAFGRISGDQGDHHVVRDAEGRLLVQGLLTATLPTKIGGDINFLAREMVFNFRLPVHSGETVRCVVTLDTVEDRETHWRISCTWVCTNRNGDTVMTGGSKGIVRKR